MFKSLFNQVAGLQVCNFIKKGFQHRCFSVNIAEFLKMLISKKIYERVLCQAKLFIHEDCKRKVKCFWTFVGKHLHRSVLFNKYSCSMQLKPTFISNKFPAMVFSWQLSERFRNNFFKERCYKKKSNVIRNVDQISIANLITHLFI